MAESSRTIDTTDRNLLRHVEMFHTHSLKFELRDPGSIPGSRHYSIG